MSDDREFASTSDNPFAAPKSRGRLATEFDSETHAYRLATRGARFGAFVIDGFLNILIIAIALVASGALVSELPAQSDPDDLDGLVALMLVPIMLGALPYFLLQVVMITRNGNTPGKALAGIKIVREQDHGPIGFARGVLLRLMVGQGLMNMIPFYWLINALMIFGEPRRCIHDLVAGSIVVGAKPVSRRPSELDLSPAER